MFKGNLQETYIFFFTVVIRTYVRSVSL